jgi:hypothetical protein
VRHCHPTPIATQTQLQPPSAALPPTPPLPRLRPCPNAVPQACAACASPRCCPPATPRTWSTCTWTRWRWWSWRQGGRAPRWRVRCRTARSAPRACRPVGGAGGLAGPWVPGTGPKHSYPAPPIKVIRAHASTHPYAPPPVPAGPFLTQAIDDREARIKEFALRVRAAVNRITGGKQARVGLLGRTSNGLARHTARPQHSRLPPYVGVSPTCLPATRQRQPDPPCHPNRPVWLPLPPAHPPTPFTHPSSPTLLRPHASSAPTTW